MAYSVETMWPAAAGYKRRNRLPKCQALVQLVLSFRWSFSRDSTPISSNPESMWSSSRHLSRLWGWFWQAEGHDNRIAAPRMSVPTRLPQKLETGGLELVCTLGNST